jgi:nitrous oxidase accessory protein
MLLAAATTIIVRVASAVPSLTAALALSQPGDTIIVESGQYREPPIVVTKPVTILGRGNPVFTGAGNHTVIRVTADGVTIEGLVVERVDPSNVAEPSAIRLDSVRACRIRGNVVRDSFFGIYGSAVTGCLIENNRVIGPDRDDQESGNAIHLWSSREVTLHGNRVERHRDGIYLEFVTASQLTDNVSERNRRYGLHFMFSDSCDYRRNQFAENGAGVAVMYSKHVTMIENRFERNRGQAAYGLLLKDISDSRLEGNRFEANTIALYLESATRVTATGNRFASNGWAVRVLANSQDVGFRGNAFLGNGFDVTTDSRQGGTEFAENFWDRYRGYDLDRDGFGDAPFRPVRLFSLVVEQNEPSLILLRSPFVDLLDAAERLLPILTPETMVDRRPLLTVPRLLVALR